MSVIYVFSATEAEARAVAGFVSLPARRDEEISCGPHRVRVFVTGIGPLAAKGFMQGVAKLKNAKPDALLVTGTCGAIAAGISEGAIIVYDASRSDGLEGREALKTDLVLTRHCASVLDQAGIEHVSATGITSSNIAASRQEKLRLATAGASVVDMETYEILSAANELRVPTAVVRVVLDGVDRELPDFSRAIAPNGGVNRLAASVIALRSPFATARLIMAQRRALRKLSRALDAILGSKELATPV